MSLLKEDVSKFTNAGISKFAVAIASLTATKPDAVQKFVDTNELNIEKLYQFLKRSKLDGKMDFVTALVGKPNNPIQKKMIKMFQESVNEETELPKVTVPASVKAKLDMAIDKIKDTKLSYNQKLNVVVSVMDSLGIDKSEFGKMASKLKGSMEEISVNEAGYTVKAKTPYEFLNGVVAVLSAYLRDEKLGPKGKRELQNILKSLEYMRMYFYANMTESVNEADVVNRQLNVKVNKMLERELGDLRKGGPNHQFAIMYILQGALTDANFHSDAKKVPSLFPKAKYEGDPMAEKDLIQMYEYDLGPNIAALAKWDGKDIVNAIGFYVSMTVGRPMGEKIEKLVEGKK